MRSLVTFLICTFICLNLFGQEKKSYSEKPKVAVVLSGGGAKGVAHIPLLQTLDSLGIVPDLVVGTSMGSIVGGLYSIGYSGDSIHTLMRDIDWNDILSGNVNVENVSVEEKSEFKRYTGEIDIVKWKPKVGNSLFRDQKLREYLSSLSYPAFRIDDFDSLSIPYRAVATDIIHGKEVVIDTGAVGMAMRASMSIPGAYKPVENETGILIDGGVVNNFPTDVAKRLGADIIIGSNVGGGMPKKEDLESISALLFQAAMLTSNLKNDEHEELCDILLLHTPNITYTTADFNKAGAIYNEGLIETKNKTQQLAELAEQLKQYEQRKHELPVAYKEFVIDSIVYKKFSDGNIDLIKARVDVENGESYTLDKITKKIERAMGTFRFDQLNYSGYYNENGNAVIELSAVEHNMHRLRAAVHFDTETGVGVIASYTGRNILGKASRLLVTLDLAQQMRGRIQYQKNFTKKMDWWWRSEVYGENLRQKLYISGFEIEDLKFNYYIGDLQINKNINNFHSYIGAGVSYDYSVLKPINNVDEINNILNIGHYKIGSFEGYLHYRYNNLSTVFNPKSGSKINVSILRSFSNSVDIHETFPDNRYKGSYNNYFKAGVNYEKRIKLSEKSTIISGVSLNYTFQDPLKQGKLSFNEEGQLKMYFLGGFLENPKKNNFVFKGLHPFELPVTQFSKINLAYQYNPFGNLFVTPHFDLAYVGFKDFNEYVSDVVDMGGYPTGHWSQLNSTSNLISAGGTLTYKTFLGPINFDVSWVNDIDQIRGFFSLGIVLGPSF